MEELYKQRFNRLENDLGDLTKKVEDMDKTTITLLHNTDKSILLIGESLKQMQEINSKQDLRMAELSNQISERDRVMVEVSNNLCQLSESQRHFNESLSETRNKVDNVEKKLEDNENKHKVDMREIQMYGYTTVMKKAVVWFLSGGGIVFIVRELVKLKG